MIATNDEFSPVHEVPTSNDRRVVITEYLTERLVKLQQHYRKLLTIPAHKHTADSVGRMRYVSNQISTIEWLIATIPA